MENRDDGNAFSFRKFLENLFLSEFFLYLFFGFLTTVINYIAFCLIDISLSKNPVFFTREKVILISQIIAFIIAVIFAFITNKLFVFKSKDLSIKVLLKEMGEFFFARIFTFVLETVGILILVNRTSLNDVIAKIIMSVICIILNYIFSKLIIFKKSTK